MALNVNRRQPHPLLHFSAPPRQHSRGELPLPRVRPVSIFIHDKRESWSWVVSHVDVRLFSCRMYVKLEVFSFEIRSWSYKAKSWAVIN